MTTHYRSVNPPTRAADILHVNDFQDSTDPDTSIDPADSRSSTVRLFELRGAANGATIDQFMHAWDVLAQAATSASDRDRAVRRRSEWAIADVTRGTSGSTPVTAEPSAFEVVAPPVHPDVPNTEVAVDDDVAWPCDVQSLTRHQVRESFGDGPASFRAA